MRIDYVFHLGERCNSFGYFKNEKLLSGLNMFNGLYISFDSILKLLNSNIDLEKNVIKFKISDLKNENSIQFINCEMYTEDEKKKITNLVQKNKFWFFAKENYYKNTDYCINIKYTDLENFEYDDSYYMKNCYCLMPNSDYSSTNFLETYKRRRDRFVECIEKNKENVVFVYMDKLTDVNFVESKMNEVINKYKLAWNLFYIIPVCNDDNKPIESYTKVYSNITFCVVQFKNLEYQLKHNPNDDNKRDLYNEEYTKIKNLFNRSYDLSIQYLFE